MTDKEACYESIKADIFDLIVWEFSGYIDSDRVHRLLDRASRSSVYESVVYSVAAGVLSEYCMSPSEQQAIRDRVTEYQDRLDKDRGFDVTDV